MQEVEVKLFPLVLISTLVGVMLGFFAAQPFNWYNNRLQDENKELQLKLNELALCELDTVVCDFEKSR